MARQRIGFLALFLCFLPIGSGAASGLWSAVAGDWKASADTVALVTGVLAGIVSAAGCIAGGFVCDRMHRQWAYVSFGILQALCAVGMALAPRTEAMFVAFTLFYAFVTGLTYVVVEGRLNKSGVFESTSLMVKHSNEYKAPHDAEKPEDAYKTLIKPQ